MFAMINKYSKKHAHRLDQLHNRDASLHEISWPYSTTVCWPDHMRLRI